MAVAWVRVVRSAWPSPIAPRHPGPTILNQAGSDHRRSVQFQPRPFNLPLTTTQSGATLQERRQPRALDPHRATHSVPSQYSPLGATAIRLDEGLDTPENPWAAPQPHLQNTPRAAPSGHFPADHAKGGQNGLTPPPATGSLDSRTPLHIGVCGAGKAPIIGVDATAVPAQQGAAHEHGYGW